MQSREASVAPVESLGILISSVCICRNELIIINHVGAARGYDEELLGGFLARSRQQSLDRRGGGDKQEKEREASTKEAAKVSDKEAEADKPPTEKKGKKPPAAPRRKRDK